MKKIFLLFILIPFLGFSQIQSGKVEYAVSMDVKMADSVIQHTDMPQLKDYIKTLIEKQKKTIPFLTFQLDFNNRESLFFKQESMGNDNGFDLDKAAGVTGAKGRYYLNLTEKKSLHEVEYIKTFFLVSFNFEELDWKITQETKMVNGYPCYKATAQHQPEVGRGGKITAWFTPKLPFQFGPMVYAGLPGLILELQQGYYIFTATQIDLSQKDKKITRPKKGKAVTLEDFPKEERKAKMNYVRTRTPN